MVSIRVGPFLRKFWSLRFRVLSGEFRVWASGFQEIRTSLTILGKDLVHDLRFGSGFEVQTEDPKVCAFPSRWSKEHKTDLA